MKMSDQIIEVLNYLCQKIGFTIDWTADNVLPYVETLCEKFIKWEISTSWMWIGISLFGILAFLVFAIIIQCADDLMDGLQWIVFVIATICFCLVIGVQIYDIITCHTFPEKVIYDYLKNLIDTGAYR